MGNFRKVIISEAQFVSLFGDKGNGIFYQDGDFVVTNDRMQKGRELFYPFYKDRYKENKTEIIHNIAYRETLRMLDNGKTLPEFNDAKIYKSMRGIPFSKKQLDYVEKNIVYPKYKDMDLEELYDDYIIDMERTSYENEIRGKKAVEKLINDGFFDKYLNGQVKDIALWSIGKLGDINDMLAWLYSRNKFTGKVNAQTIFNEMKKTMDEVCDSDDYFLYNDLFLALDHILTSINKLNKRP